MMIKTRVQKAELRASNPYLVILTILLLALSLIGLSCVVISIYVSRPIGDDFGAISFYRPDVWLPHTLNSLSHTGRYGQSFFGAIIYGLFQGKTSNIFPLITLTWFMAVTYLFVKFFIDKKIQPSPKNLSLSVIFTVLLTFLTLFVNNNVENINPPTWFTYQTFFWPSGIITYTLPFLLLVSAVYLGFIRKNGLSNKKKLFILAIAVYFTGLFNETQPTTIFFISSALLCLSFIKSLRTYRPHYFIAASLSLLSLATLFFSPGSQKRQAATGVLHRGNIVHSVLHNFWTSISHLMFRPRELVLILLCGFLVALLLRPYVRRDTSGHRPIAVRGMLAGLLLVFFALGSLACSLTLLAVGYGEYTGIYTRTLLITQLCYTFGLTLLATSISILCLSGLKKVPINILTCVSIVLFLILSPHYLHKIVAQLNSSLGYSNAWASEEPVILHDKKANNQQIIYLPQSVAGIGDGFSLSCTGPFAGSTDWLNHVIEQYYAVKKVCSIQDKPLLGPGRQN